MNKQRAINSLFFITLLALLVASVKSGGMSPLFAMVFAIVLGFGVGFFSVKQKD